MDSRLLTDGFIKAFEGRVQQSTEVWLASAWVTKSQSLDYLMASGRDVRALVGTHGNATDPGCLRAMIDQLGPDSLQVVRGEGRLFHPKLYLFHSDGDATATWTGSANFTGASLASNREILLDSDDQSVVSQLKSWFDKEWKALRDQNVENEASAYEKRRQAMGVGSLSAVVEAGTSSGPSTSRPQRFQFESAPDRGPRNYSGAVVVSYANGTKKKKVL